MSCAALLVDPWIPQHIGFGLWCLTPLSTLFQLYQPTISHTRGEYANHYTTDAVYNFGFKKGEKRQGTKEDTLEQRLVGSESG
jgi:hypothetical protein